MGAGIGLRQMAPPSPCHRAGVRRGTPSCFNRQHFIVAHPELEASVPPPPTLGQHNEEILSGLRFATLIAEISALAAEATGGHR